MRVTVLTEVEYLVTIFLCLTLSNRAIIQSREFTTVSHLYSPLDSRYFFFMLSPFRTQDNMAHDNLLSLVALNKHCPSAISPKPCTAIDLSSTECHGLSSTVALSLYLSREYQILQVRLHHYMSQKPLFSVPDVTYYSHFYFHFLLKRRRYSHIQFKVSFSSFFRTIFLLVLFHYEKIVQHTQEGRYQVIV